MPATLRNGSRGFEIAVAQAQLRAKSSPSLRVDGAFGPLMQAAVISFQRRVGLFPDGIVGPKTHAALAQGLTLSTADHNVTHIAQPTICTCWAASTAMMTRSTVAAVCAKTPADMIGPGGGLLNHSSVSNPKTKDQALVDGTLYCNIHGLRCHAPMSWTVAALVDALRRSPLMFDMLWNSSEYAAGKGSPGHAIVISAVVSDNNSSGNETYLLVLDPWPTNVGKISWVEYRAWINEVPTRTYRVYNR